MLLKKKNQTIKLEQNFIKHLLLLYIIYDGS